MIRIEDVYNKALNLLVGSGASFGLFPTLELGMKKDDGKPWSLEELAARLSAEEDAREIPLFMHYYAECIYPAQQFAIASVSDEDGKRVVANYRTFLKTLLTLVQRRAPLDRRCNVFTTNYDGCIPLVADQILESNSDDFVINDGTRGFRTKLLEARNFDSYLCRSGVFDRHASGIPQINLIHLHGSVYWQKVERGIEVDYTRKPLSILSDRARAKLAPFSAVLRDKTKTLADLPHVPFTKAARAAFWDAYKRMPIVNPTKWKFHETVYEEHYYQMLRMLSYELEKPNAVLITFGFSFADEHILNLVKRSLSNPSLQVFICCFTKDTRVALEYHFGAFPNVKLLALEDGSKMTFSRFNDEVFTLRGTRTTGASSSTTVTSESATPAEAGGGGAA